MDHCAEKSIPSIEVELSDTQTHLRIAPERASELVRQVLAIEGVRNASISLVIVDNQTIREINREHLGHDWETDVITFPLSDPDEEPLLGELVVSAEMAKTSAAEVGEDPWAELALYVVHGLLHLLGYDDLSEAEAAAMRRREGEVLALLGLKNLYPLIGVRSPNRAEPE